MTKIINNVMHVDSTTDAVPSNINEVLSSVDYVLNSAIQKLTLIGPTDGEIKGDYLVYGYPDKWELDYLQGNGHNASTKDGVVYEIWDSSRVRWETTHQYKIGGLWCVLTESYS